MRLFRASVLVLVIAGCGGGDGPTDNGTGGPVASVQISAASGNLTIGQTRNLTVTLRNAQNNTLSGRAVSWAVVPTTGVVSLSATSGAQNTATATGAGTATVTATSEGVSDDVMITVAGSAPSQESVTLSASSFVPPSVTIARNGSVTWSNNSGVAHTLEFDNPPAGVTDVPNFASGQEHSRSFTTAGTFNYSCSIHPGMNGSVIVQP